MFRLTLGTHEEKLVDYLTIESTVERSTLDEEVYLFSSKLKASAVLADYFYHTLRHHYFTVLCKGLYSDDEVGLFDSHLSETDNLWYREQIAAALLEQFDETEEDCLFYHEAFFTFRMKVIKEAFVSRYDGIVSAYAASDEGYTHLYDLKKKYNKSLPTTHSLHLFIEDNCHYILRDERRIFLSTPEIDEDYVLSYLLTLAPTNLTVHDSKHALSHEAVMILTYIFQEGVTFLHDNYTNYFDQ